MNRSRIRFAVGSLLVALWLPSVTAAAQTGSPPGDELAEDWLIENFRWTGSPGAGATVEIRNLHGDLRVRPSEDAQIFLSAMIQRHRDDPLRAEIARRGDETGFVIEVVYPSAEDTDRALDLEPWRKRRVDLTVFLPVKKKLVGVTARGLIEIKGWLLPIEARSVGGDVVLSTAGPVTAYTERGEIQAQLKSTRWEESSLETLTGSISVLLPPAASATVHMETYGELTTDYSLEVSREPDSQRKRAVAVIGQGDAQLCLKSNRGNLKLLRSAF